MHLCFVVLRELTCLLVCGRDRLALLNNLTTQQLKDLKQGESRETFLTDVKGRILSHGLVGNVGETVMMILMATDGATIMAHIDRYTIREDVTATDQSQEWTWIAVSNPPSFPRLRNSPVDASGSSITRRMAESSFEWNQEDVPCRILDWPLVGPSSMLIGVECRHIEALKKTLLAQGYLEEDSSWFEWRRIQSHWPWFGLDFDSSNLPQEIDRDDFAISFTKGCYLGQETVARLDALGQIQKKLCRIHMFVDGDPGTWHDAYRRPIVLGEKQIGELRSLAWNRDAERIEGFAWLRRGYFDAGSRFDCDGYHIEVLRPARAVNEST